VRHAARGESHPAALTFHRRFFRRSEDLLDRKGPSAVLVSMNPTATIRPFVLSLLVATACAPSIAHGTVPASTADPPRGCGETMSCEGSPDPDPTGAVDSPTAPPTPVAIRSPEERRPQPPSYPYRVRIVDEGDRDLPRFSHDGRTYVLGERGARYAVVVSNPTARRVEAVISIDGLDAVDGKPADYARKGGYVIAPYGSTTVEGFRTSLDRVATFRFSSVADSYAGRLGQARDVGVIGVAFFPERPPVVVVPPQPPPEPIFFDAPHSSQERRDSPAPAARSVPERPSPAPAAAGAPRGMVKSERSGLGTEFGEARDSHVEEVAFVRANQSTPAQIATVRYNDRAGLMALGISVDPSDVSQAEVHKRETADPFRANRFAVPPP